MNKQILIPLHSLADPDAVSFLELSVESAPDHAHNPYRSLGGFGLETAVATARVALQSLPPTATPTAIRVTAACRGRSLTNSSGAALGVTLGPLLLQQGFPYRRYLLMGGLRLPDDPSLGLYPDGIAVSAVRGTVPMLRAIQRRGYQREPLLLLLAADSDDAPTRTLLRALAPLNVAAHQVCDLSAAYRACRGLRPGPRELEHV